MHALPRLFAALTVLLSSTSACTFDADASLEGGPRSGTGSGNNDAEGDPDAGMDGGSSYKPSGASGTPDAGETFTADRCRDDTGCPPDQACVFADSARDCVPRCSPEGTCFAHDIGSWDGSIASDGSRVCYALDGTDTKNGKIFSWDITGTPLEVANNLIDPEVLLASLRHCYVSTPRGLVRVTLSSKRPLQWLTKTSARTNSIWSTSSHVYFVKMADDGSGPELHRVAHTSGAMPELVASRTIGAWTAGNSTELFGVRQSSMQIQRAPLSNPATLTPIDVSGVPLYADDQAVYFPRSLSGMKVDLDRFDLATETITTVGNTMGSGVHHYAIEGDWLYFSYVEMTATANLIHFVRASTRGLVPDQEVLIVSGLSRPPFVVARNHIVRFQRDRIVANAISAAPCNEQMSCAFGTTCSAQGTCE